MKGGRRQVHRRKQRVHRVVLSGIGLCEIVLRLRPRAPGKRAAVARAHTQSLINAAALAFATGELTSSKDFATPTPR
jgi:hypothetical protein